MSKQCASEAAFRYTWPGRDESFICVDHAPRLEAVADAMGLSLQIIALDPTAERDREVCRQQVSG